MNETTTRLAAALSDRYRIERELGAGGMATVYLAHDVRHDRRVALKVLRPELSAILGAERFLAEIKTTANLQHPHILGLFDSGEAAGNVFYVMPYVEGESLRDRLARDHQLPVDEAVRIAREVADALEYAHQNGVVHRDIKPENILIHGGHAVVADFGIALAASRSEGGARMTETGMSLGTPHYMSPEQAMGEREITAKSDIYALGCVLYEMLTAEPPFVGASAQAIIGRVLTEEPRSLTAQRKTIPPHVEAAVHMALAKLPADRFASAKEFGDALARTDFAPAGTRATVGAAARATERSTPRQRALRATPWVIALAGVATSTWLAVNQQEPAVSRQRTLLWSRPISAGSVGLNTAISPDGKTIVYFDTVGGARQLWTKERDRLDGVPVAGTVTPSGNMGPTFSPDGEWIAFVADGKVKRVPRLGGSAITVADSANDVLPALAWLDDGTILYNNARYDLQAISVDASESRRVLNVDSLQRGVVAVSPLPRGRGALVIPCTFGCSESDLRVLDLRTGALRALTNEVLRAWYVPSGDVVFVRRDGGVFMAPFDLDKLTFRTAPVPVLDGVRASPGSADMTLSPSGTLLYVGGAASAVAQLAEAVWVTREGLVSPIDPSWSYQPSPNSGVALSPDGRRLAVSAIVSGKLDIWVKELPAGPFTRLTFDGLNSRPTWTADGRSVMYVTQKPGKSEDVGARRSDGTGVEAVLFDGARIVAEVQRTRDTTRLIVRLGAPPTRDIYLAERTADSAKVSALVANDGYDEVHPALSPDGRWIAYASNESGRQEVYVRPFPDANGGRWQVSRNGGNAPRWAHSGRELFFRDGSGAMVAAAVKSGAAFELGEQKTLFSAAGLLQSSTTPLWAITPDDRRFVFLRAVGTQAAVNPVPVTVIRVDNWLAELKSGRASRP